MTITATFILDGTATLVFSAMVEDLVDPIRSTAKVRVDIHAPEGVKKPALVLTEQNLKMTDAEITMMRTLQDCIEDIDQERI